MRTLVRPPTLVGNDVRAGTRTRNGVLDFDVLKGRPIRVLVPCLVSNELRAGTLTRSGVLVGRLWIIQLKVKYSSLPPHSLQLLEESDIASYTLEAGEAAGKGRRGDVGEGDE